MIFVNGLNRTNIFKKIIIGSISIVIIFVLFLFLNININAITLPNDNNEDEMYFAYLYDNSNGLPTSEANAIAQTSDGYIWIGSYSGLVCYDGNEFKRFDSSTGIASVVSLFVDSKDRLWIGTNDSGIALMKGEDFTFFGFDTQSSNSIKAICEDNDGNIYAATTKGIYYIDNDMNYNQLSDPKLDVEYICELYKASDGAIYGVTNSGLVFIIKNCRVVSIIKPNEELVGIINAVWPDMANPGFAYLGNKTSKIYYGNIEAGFNTILAQYDVAPLANINSIRQHDNLVWIVSDYGIGYIKQNDQVVILEDIPLDNSIDRMIVDHEGNYWFTSSRQGLMKLVRTIFNDISDLASLDPVVVNSTCVLNDNLYVASDNGLFIIDNNYHIVNNDLTNMLSGFRIRCIIKDTLNNLWFCTYPKQSGGGEIAHGLVRYNESNNEIKTFTEADGLCSNWVRTAIELSNGTILVTGSGGVNVISGDEIIKTYNSEAGLTNLEILCLAEASDGKLLLGSDGDGIYVLDDNKVTNISSSEGLKSKVILRIKKDNVYDLYWIITSNSIAYLKDGKIYNVTDFPYSNNFDLHFDDYDRVWILSSNGIYCVNKSGMINNEVEYVLYDNASGIPGITTANSYSYLSEDKTLYVSSGTGVFSMNLNADFSILGKVLLGVPYLMVDDQYVQIDGENTITLPSDTIRISIYAKAFTYSLYNPHLMYYLEGFDTEPIYTNKNDLSYITYTNLKGGTYVFHLSLINSLTGEIEDSLEVTIIKEKSLTEKTWFWVLVVALNAILLMGIVFIFYKFKTNRLIKKHKENQKLINEMTQVFARCIDMKDAYTNGHSSRVAKYTMMIAKELGKSEEEVEKIYNIALLHDIGKISIPDNILNKPGKLDDEEYKVMKLHSPNGYDILKDITIAPGIALGAGCHHERYDGKGYPNGLKGDEIPEVAQIIAVADTFDAMYSTRPYRRKLPLEEVVNEIKRCSGAQFNPLVVEAFLRLIEKGEIKEEKEEE